jgi:uncharacterized membrane protein YhaH (DUF805 family)
MDFVGAIKSGFENFFNFKGVATRSEYWYWFLFTVLVNILTSFIDKVTDSSIISTVVSVALLIPSLAVLFRRLRDAGYRSAWAWSAIAVSLVFVFALIAFIVSLFLVGLDYSVVANPDLMTDAMLTDWFSNPAVLVFLFLTLITGLAALVLNVIVNIAFCIQPTKTAEQGNKYVLPKNPTI